MFSMSTTESEFVSREEYDHVVAERDRYKDLMKIAFSVLVALMITLGYPAILGVLLVAGKI